MQSTTIDFECSSHLPPIFRDVALARLISDVSGRLLHGMSSGRLGSAHEIVPELLAANARESILPLLVLHLRSPSSVDEGLRRDLHPGSC